MQGLMRVDSDSQLPASVVEMANRLAEAEGIPLSGLTILGGKPYINTTGLDVKLQNKVRQEGLILKAVEYEPAMEAGQDNGLRAGGTGMVILFDKPGFMEALKMIANSAVNEAMIDKLTETFTLRFRMNGWASDKTLRMASMRNADFVNHMAARRATNRAKREAVGTGLTSLEEMEVGETDVKGMDPAWEVKQPAEQKPEPQRPAPVKPQASDTMNMMDQLRKLSETDIVKGKALTDLQDWVTRKHIQEDIKTAWDHYRPQIELMEEGRHHQAVQETMTECFGKDAPVSPKEDWLANFREQNHQEMVRLILDLVDRNKPNLDAAAMAAIQPYRQTWSSSALETLNKTQLLGLAIQLWTVLEKGATS